MCVVDRSARAALGSPTRTVSVGSNTADTKCQTSLMLRARFIRKTAFVYANMQSLTFVPSLVRSMRYPCDVRLEPLIARRYDGGGNLLGV
ncbi:hypothetical protein EVAR_59457_1 [Eumeta japonica]|uniref:Uncharacterized protein n=1 Tax=Eumeta variegata TaxID=151549 RepID=A0A4C1ZSG6_EUMVA|nr:hypothetical protein EVAR_59457_1 [Eumeta japonica]